MECTDIVSSRGSLVAFGIARETWTLEEMFTACMHCLSMARLHVKTKSFEVALKLSLITLRFSRWGEAVSIYQEHPLAMVELNPGTVNEAKAALWGLLSLLQAEKPVLPDSSWLSRLFPRRRPRAAELLGVMDVIIQERSTNAFMKRLPESQHLHDYQGHIEWSTEQYKMAAEYIELLEMSSTARELRQLITKDHAKIAHSKLAWTISLPEIDAKNLDPWFKTWIERQEAIRRRKDRFDTLKVARRFATRRYARVGSRNAWRSAFI